MADIKVELNSDDINKAIADAIVKSTLGDTIIKMTNDYVKQIQNSYDSPIKKVVESTARDLIIELIQAKKEIIREEVEKRLTSAVVDDIVTKAIESIIKSY